MVRKKVSTVPRCNASSGATKAVPVAAKSASPLAPVHPKRHHVPLTISGPHAEAAKAILKALDMRPEIAGHEVGQASTIKMLRSVMVKGMEALMAECFLSARRAGVEDQVLASLSGSFPETDWPLRGAYNLERMIVHGRRRAAEMREVALTVEALGLPADMVHACVEWQERIGQTGADPGEDVLETRLDAVLNTL